MDFFKYQLGNEKKLNIKHEPKKRRNHQFLRRNKTANYNFRKRKGNVSVADYDKDESKVKMILNKTISINTRNETFLTLNNYQFTSQKSNSAIVSQASCEIKRKMRNMNIIHRTRPVTQEKLLMDDREFQEINSRINFVNPS